MKYGKVLVFNLVIILIGATIYFVVSNRANFFKTPSNVPNSPNEQATLTTQTATFGSVTYKVTPKNLAKSSSNWDFEIVLDTHTGSLDQDLVSQVRLSDEKGREFQVAKWEGDPPGGHHREGVMKFESQGSDTASVTLKINPGENMKETSFTWEVKTNE